MAFKLILHMHTLHMYKGSVAKLEILKSKRIYFETFFEKQSSLYQTI